MEGKVSSKQNKFLKLNMEKKEHNQYWFSEPTINFICDQIIKNCVKNGKIGLISCPSVFFTLSSDVQEFSYLFDIDEKLIKKHKNGVMYDFNDYEKVAEEFKQQFDFLVIDPPFIVKEVWEKFASFAKLILKEEGKILVSSINENKDLLKSLLNLDIKAYQPSIPHLVYQYNFFSNYEDDLLNEKNPELLEN